MWEGERQFGTNQKNSHQVFGVNIYSGTFNTVIWAQKRYHRGDQIKHRRFLVADH